MLSSFGQLPSRVKVGSKYVGEGEPTFFIAEVGNNHNGDYYLAKKTIEESVRAGADAVKLQKRFIGETFARELLERPQTKDQIYGKTYGEYRMALELNQEEFENLKKFSEQLGVVFFATPFDKKSVDFLEEVGVDVYKIASFDVTNIPLLEYVAQKGKPMFLSTGAATIDELDEAVTAILKYNNQLMINHCVSIYPTPDEKLNLATIPFLKERYKPLPIGYSGHEHDYLPTLAAVAMGAKMVERHITLDKAMPGPDHATVSIEPEEFQAMVASTRRLEKAWGLPVKQLTDEELQTRNKHGKSVVATHPIAAGTIITAEMLTCKSPGYGLKPNMLGQLVGKFARVDITGDAVIKREDIVWPDAVPTQPVPGIIMDHRVGGQV
ncbi:MAG: N-acetylneuraminate synthase family protein [bacterium]|nr:N-acetylneuraminate synthase family protein [bacterium]MDZ4296157.1 N-acetylneuraminate synthase family protein [Patescibacteria group bacterium]